MDYPSELAQALQQQLDAYRSSLLRSQLPASQQLAPAHEQAPARAAQFSSSAALVAQMHHAFTDYLHGPDVVLGHREFLTGDLVQLEDSWKHRRRSVSRVGFLWGSWGEKLLNVLSLFFPGAELKLQTMEVARELEQIESQALVSLQEAKHQHYQDQFDAWRRMQMTRQTLLMVQSVVLQIANDIIVAVRRLDLSEENQEEMAKLLFEEIAIPKILEDLQMAEDEDQDRSEGRDVQR